LNISLALALGLTLLPTSALAFLGTSVKVGVRDAETGKPLDGGFVVVREYAEVGQLHGSRRYCVRAQAAAADAPWVKLSLPSPGRDALVRARALEGIAYRPGYCLARIGDARAAASHKRMNLGMAAPSELDASVDNRFAMRRGSQTPEERLLYLEAVAAGLFCHEARWGDGSKEAMARLADAMLGEANSLARSKYERHLARRVAAGLEIARGLPEVSDTGHMGMFNRPTNEPGVARDFLIGPADFRIAWGDGGRMVVAATPAPIAAAAPAPPAGAGAMAPPPGMRLPQMGIIRPAGVPPPPPLVVHCRHGAPSACDLEQRDSNGATALYSLAAAGKVDEVRVLLEAGADPNATKGPRGDTAMDVVLRQILLNYDNSEKAAQVLDALASNPRTMIRAALREELTTDPATWQAHPARARERILQRREALLRLPVRPPDPAPACEDPNFEHRYREIPPRLR
jgi:hypothetical protein